MNKLDTAKRIAELASELRSIHGPNSTSTIKFNTRDRLVAVSSKLQELADQLVHEGFDEERE